MRIKFDEQLEKLNNELILMGSLCENAISKSVKALERKDIALAEEVFETDNQIDQKEKDIEALCMKLILRQQPVARDLRAISSALKMISDMERIGDQASDIAEIVKYIKDNNAQSKMHINDMARASIKMVTDSVESFVKKDLKLARAVIKYDDTVDDLFEKVKKEIAVLIGQNNENGEYCLDLLMIAKYLERSGDHAVNIAQWVEFSITGSHKKY